MTVSDCFRVTNLLLKVLTLVRHIGKLSLCHLLFGNRFEYDESEEYNDGENIGC